MTPLTARMGGIVRSPRATLTELAATPRAPWLDVLCASTVVIFLALVALLATSVGQIALVDQWERTALAFGRTVDDGFYARLQELSTHWVAYSAGMAILTGPVLTFGVAVVIAGLLRWAGTSTASFASVLSVVSHASIILALRQVVGAPIDYLLETFASPTTLVQVVPGLDETSSLARFLGVVDVFVMWWAIVLAVGIAIVARRRMGSVALMFIGVYMAIAVLLALAMAATGGSA